MRNLLGLVAGVLFSLTSHCQADLVTDLAPFKGADVVNQLLHERILKPDAVFEIGARYLGDEYGFGISKLLGKYQSNGLNEDFVNGEPNVINMLLYNLVFSDLSSDIASLCAPGPAPQPSEKRQLGPRADQTFFPDAVNSDFENALKPFCSWPSAQARSDSALFGFWNVLMSFDAPMEEFEEWKNFFQGPTYAQRSPKDTIAAMSMSLLMNPYFLLKE